MKIYQLLILATQIEFWTKFFDSFVVFSYRFSIWFFLIAPITKKEEKEDEIRLYLFSMRETHIKLFLNCSLIDSQNQIQLFLLSFPHLPRLSLSLGSV